MTDRTVAARQAALRQRRLDDGIVRVEVWVHKSNKAKIRELAKQLEKPARQADEKEKR